MARKRKVHWAVFNAQVALTAHEGDRTINELASHIRAHPTPIHRIFSRLRFGVRLIAGLVVIF